MAKLARIDRHNLEQEWDKNSVKRGWELEGHIESGRLELHQEPITEETLADIHAQPNSKVIYVDASAKMSIGAGAWIDFENLTPVSLRSARHRGLVCDGFTSEQQTLRCALNGLERQRASTGCNESEQGQHALDILTDSLSNIASLRAPRVRDGREAAIQKTISELCNSGHRVRVRFVKSRRGFVGNEIVDAAAAAERKAATATTTRPFTRGEWTIPKHIARARILNWAEEAQIGSVARQAPASDSIQALLACADLGANPTVNHGSALELSRREEVVLNQMRMGVQTHVTGFQANPKAKAKCRACGEIAGQFHLLLDCNAADSARAELLNEANEEIEVNQAQQNAERTWRGLKPRKAETMKVLCPAVLGKCPKAVGNFVGKCRIWMDELTKQAGIQEARPPQ